MEKAKACKTLEELLALAKEEGYELSDDELNQISGGGGWDDLEYALSYCVSRGE